MTLCVTRHDVTRPVDLCQELGDLLRAADGRDQAGADHTRDLMGGNWTKWIRPDHKIDGWGQAIILPSLNPP